MTTSEASGRLVIRGHLISDDRSIGDGAVAFDGDRIAFAGPAAEFETLPEAGSYAGVDVPAGSLLLPGLVDLHCHGAAGGDFASADPAMVRRAVDFLHQAGTTTLLASLVSAPPEAMLEAAGTLAGLAEEGLVEGIHAEGPFLAASRCGAQDPSVLTDPDPGFVDALVAVSRGQLRTMTYAPELADADGLVEQLAQHGVVPSIGHTDADLETTAASLRLAREELASAGFDGFTERPTVTHLFNAMTPPHHRRPGAVTACLEAAATGGAVVELIADGHHLAPETVRAVFALAGPEAVALVTDSMAATGLPDGDYRLGRADVVVRGGEARLAADGRLAGGTATLLEVLRSTVEAGVPLAEAVVSATCVPATVLGLADEVGALHAGFRADLLVLSPDLRLRAVYRRGVELEPNNRAT
ncbi:N-acetylglucosamine-6-phosphate deacetylase [Zafaria cholistanensis]|uniref:N-acetylglucosamine-6-phosphate deacetylase n=1 Tax=Zafaria cholistanensis TaxID=1682741 RepID=A0A5A7NTJ2_9MICC|nr:amidohydrolase family protein [Zafaria cholistanensis]GER24175.1 N-acetylglucosamine-6-phosphate deacetylase [Zafaria cholistanensis]